MTVPIGFLLASHPLSPFGPIPVGDSGIGEYVRTVVYEPLQEPVPPPEPEPSRRALR
jgi:hypothetical protein